MLAKQIYLYFRTDPGIILHMRIGIDLDNTIINYDGAFVAAAKSKALIDNSFSGTKQQLRDHIRTLPDGETEWQKLQGYVYGKGIGNAALYPGVKDFLQSAVDHELFIVSHKTQFGHYDADKINLRDAAMAFLEVQGILPMIPKNRIFFLPTRSEKVNLIASLALGWFIDDLVEVYEEANFPANIRTVLFHTPSHPAPKGHWQVCTCWDDITKTIFA